jgi:hypothetical protein
MPSFKLFCFLFLFFAMVQKAHAQKTEPVTKTYQMHFVDEKDEQSLQIKLPEADTPEGFTFLMQNGKIQMATIKKRFKKNVFNLELPENKQQIDKLIIYTKSGNNIILDVLPNRDQNLYSAF